MSILFSPITIEGLVFRNRVVMPPMVRLTPLMPPEVVETGGQVTDTVLDHYLLRARAGTGLIVVEATAVDPAGRVWKHGLNAYADEHVAALTRLVEGIHTQGAVASIQLVHGGPQSSAHITGLETVGPSTVPSSERGTIPRQISVEEIAAVQQRFAQAAARAVAAGFDMVEIHGAHGYLLDSFLSRRTNQRTDEYGGDMAGRMRMLVETCRAVKTHIGTRALLCCRISVFNKLEEGFSSDDFTQLVTGLVGSGIDILHISTDGALKGYFGTDKTIQAWARETTSLPIIVAGGLGNPRDAERVLAQGHADLVAIGTAMLKDPAWTQHAREMLVGH
ncbi:MAG: NADH:flavin oxidoreductase [Chloroflexi bacterium]|nr:NADH:flavin oxidoreductase [Chloroflexota bacterium]